MSGDGQSDTEWVRQDTNVCPVIRSSLLAGSISLPMWDWVWVTSRWHLQSLSLKVWASKPVSKCNRSGRTESSLVNLIYYGHTSLNCSLFCVDVVCTLFSLRFQYLVRSILSTRSSQNTISWTDKDKNKKVRGWMYLHVIVTGLCASTHFLCLAP